MKHHLKSVRRGAMALLLALFLAAQTFAAMPEHLIPGGNTVGIQLYSQGLVVTDVLNRTPAQAAGLRAGDAILKIDGMPATTAQALSAAVQSGDAVVLTVLRGQQEAEFLVQPEDTGDGYQLGLCLKDHIAGIGTVTYYDPDSGAFGALGHGVGGLVDEKLLPITSGFVVASSVADVQKGSSGTPGALKGEFDLTGAIGTVTGNHEHGIFGTMNEVPRKAALPVGDGESVKAGAATILSNVEGDRVESYEVVIERVYPNAKNGRNLLLRVTDERLLEKTGGIVQGMSGSTIIQNGKIVGAVTHVLVNDPTRGYGIFIENMLNAAA